MRSTVGLTVILDNCKDPSAKKVVSKGSTIMIKPTSNPPSPSSPFSSTFTNNNNNNNMMMFSFLDCCSLCHQKLLPGKDIYMYKGDMAFCSEECRCRQIFMDEDDDDAAKNGCTTNRSEYNCSSGKEAAAAAKAHRVFAAY